MREEKSSLHFGEQGEKERPHACISQLPTWRKQAVNTMVRVQATLEQVDAHLLCCQGISNSPTYPISQAVLPY